jgi:hypothetical protein
LLYATFFVIFMTVHHTDFNEETRSILKQKVAMIVTELLSFYDLRVGRLQQLSV